MQDEIEKNRLVTSEHVRFVHFLNHKVKYEVNNVLACTKILGMFLSS